MAAVLRRVVGPQFQKSREASRLLTGKAAPAFTSPSATDTSAR
jgi:hypothetical protein